MSNVRKITALILSIVMLSLSAVSICAYASTANLRYFERGVLTDGTNTAYYIIDKDNKTLYLASDGVTNARTPDYPSADSGPFAGRTDVNTIIIEENVEYIGDYVFANMTAVSKLEIQSNLLSSSNSMSSKAMIGCTGLRTIQGESSIVSTDVLLQVVKGALNIASGNWVSLALNGLNIIKTGTSDDALPDEAVHAMVNDYIMTGKEVFLGDLDAAIDACQAREQEPCYWENAYHHQYTSYVSVQQSCTSRGERTYVCSVCSHSYFEYFGEALGHDYVYETLYEPACTKEGFSKGVCSRCNDVVFIPIPIKGHTTGRWVVTALPTSTANGSMKCLCADCNDTLRTINISIANNVKYAYRVGVDPNTNTAAAVAAELETESCASTPVKNGSIMADTDLIGTGCKIYVSSSARYAVTDIYTVVLYGDINGDGLINDADFGILFNQVNNTSLTIPENSVYKRAADLNHDGILDAFDLALLDLQITNAKALDQTVAQN